MVRTKGVKQEPADRKQIQNNTELVGSSVNRALLASYLGFQYGGDRNIYQALGYKTDLTYNDYYSRYARQDIAKAIIDRPVKATWQGELELVESNKAEETEFEKKWRLLNKELGIKSRLARLDRLTGIGHYGALLLGFDDVKTVEDFAKPVGRVTSIKYIRPFGEKTAVIKNFEENTSDPRYGMPSIYELEAGDVRTKGAKMIKVHYSRILHVTDSPLESEIQGTPVLEAVFNRLMDIEKIVGGDAEMFWRGARPGYQGKLDPDFKSTKAFEEDLQKQMKEYEHDLTRFLINEGVELKSLAQQIADPSTHLDSQLKMISAETGIPLRILTGSERGELASSEDRSEWLSYVQARREEYAEPCILRPFIDMLIKLNLLPKPSDDYSIKWADLFAQSEKARVEIGKSRANALREYTSNPMAEAVIPPNAFMEFFLGLTVDQVELINQMRDAEMMEEVKKMKDVKDILGEGVIQPAQKDEKKSKEQKGEPVKKREMPSATV